MKFILLDWAQVPTHGIIFLFMFRSPRIPYGIRFCKWSIVTWLGVFSLVHHLSVIFKQTRCQHIFYWFRIILFNNFANSSYKLFDIILHSADVHSSSPLTVLFLYIVLLDWIFLSWYLSRRADPWALWWCDCIMKKSSRHVEITPYSVSFGYVLDSYSNFSVEFICDLYWFSDSFLFI